MGSIPNLLSDLLGIEGSLAGTGDKPGAAPLANFWDWSGSVESGGQDMLLVQGEDYGIKKTTSDASKLSSVT